MGMKPIEDVLKIVNEKEAEILDKTSNVSILSKLADDKYLVKYSGQINDSIRKLNLNDPLSKKNKNKNRIYTSSELRELGFNKKYPLLLQYILRQLFPLMQEWLLTNIKIFLETHV